MEYLFTLELSYKSNSEAFVSLAIFIHFSPFYVIVYFSNLNFTFPLLNSAIMSHSAPPNVGSFLHHFENVSERFSKGFPPIKR